MNKPFDAVAWMRRKREEIDKEDRELSWQEKRSKTLSLVAKDPLWQRLKQRLIEYPTDEKLLK